MRSIWCYILSTSNIRNCYINFFPVFRRFLLESMIIRRNERSSRKILAKFIAFVRKMTPYPTHPMKETRNKLSGNYNEAQRLHLSIPQKVGTTDCHPGRNTNYCCEPDLERCQTGSLRPDTLLSTLQQWPWCCNGKKIE